MVWCSSELKSGERMLMICRENEARPDESPAKVFINTKTLGKRGREGGRGEDGEVEGVGWGKSGLNTQETEEKVKIKSRYS